MFRFPALVVEYCMYSVLRYYDNPVQILCASVAQLVETSPTQGILTMISSWLDDKRGILLAQSDPWQQIYDVASISKVLHLTYSLDSGVNEYLAMGCERFYQCASAMRPIGCCTVYSPVS